MTLIGITPSGMDDLDQKIRHDYVNAVLRAGAIPLIFPMTKDEKVIHGMLSAMDGVLVSGGVDIHPRYYGEDVLPCCGEINEFRDAMEEVVLRRALEMDMPLLCICRGMQFINCIQGGSLYQDLDAQFTDPLRHSRSDVPREPVHEVKVAEGSLLHRITGLNTLQVNSRHHQGVKKLGDIFQLCATSPDGLVEAMSIPTKRFALAVQWHPESLSDRHEDAHKLFDAFVKACQCKK